MVLRKDDSFETTRAERFTIPKGCSEDHKRERAGFKLGGGWEGEFRAGYEMGGAFQDKLRGLLTPSPQTVDIEQGENSRGGHRAGSWVFAHPILMATADIWKRFAEIFLVHVSTFYTQGAGTGDTFYYLATQSSLHGKVPQLTSVVNGQLLFFFFLFSFFANLQQDKLKKYYEI